MRFVGLKSKKRKSKKEFGTLKREDNKTIEEIKEVAKTTPIMINQSDFEQSILVKNKKINVQTQEILLKEKYVKPKIKEESKKRFCSPMDNDNPMEISVPEINNEIHEQKQKIIKMSPNEINIEIQSCRIERNVEKMLFETGSAKNVDIEVQNEIDLGASDIKFPSGLRSPSHQSNDFRSETNSEMRMFDEVPRSIQSQENNFNIEDLRNFHKKGKKNCSKGRVEVTERQIQSMQDNELAENRRLTMKETNTSVNSNREKFKKNYSNAHLSQKNKEDFLDPKFDSAIPKITKMIQGKGGIEFGESENLEFLLTKNVEKPKKKVKMVDVKEITNDMDMIINGIDSMILARDKETTMKSRISDNNFEYSRTNFKAEETDFQLSKILRNQKSSEIGRKSKEITNLISEAESKKKFSNFNDDELKKMKEDLNLKANTQEMRDYLSIENSEVITESHPFLTGEPADLRSSLEKYAVNLERIEEENVQTRDSNYFKERELKQNEDPFEQKFKFEVTRDQRKSQKPPTRT